MAEARKQFKASRREARRCPSLRIMHECDALRALVKFNFARVWFNLPARSLLP